MTPLVFVLSVLTSVVGGILYTFLFHRRVENFRKYLKKSRSKREDLLIQKAMIDEIRGAGRTKRFGFLLLTVLIPIVLLSLQVVSAPASVVQSMVSLTKQADKAVHQLENSKNGVQKEAADQDTDRIAEAESVRELVRSVRNASFVLAVVCFLVFLGYWVFIFRMIPQVIVGTIFGGIINEFSSRIHQLATKEEIAELWRAELKVSDEESLFRYFDVAAQVAKRHKVEDAVSFVAAWKESKLHLESKE